MIMLAECIFIGCLVLDSRAKPGQTGKQIHGRVQKQYTLHLNKAEATILNIVGDFK